MVGKYFITLTKENRLGTQGRIQKRLEYGHYMILLFDIFGFPSEERIVSVKDMRKSWLFFEAGLPA